MKSLMCMMTMVGILAASGLQAFAAGDEWRFEIAPTLWFASIDADISVGDQTVTVDPDFGDIFDALDGVFAFSFEAGKGPWYIGGTFDYLSLDPNSGDTKGPPGADLEVESTVINLGIGYTFELPWRGATCGVGPGIRFTELESEVSVTTPQGPASTEADIELVDALLVLRPSFPLGDQWRFNPAITIGAGDSELTYDLMPNFQYMFNETWYSRLGYRQLYYDAEDGQGALDGSFQGFFLTVGANL